MHLDKQSFMFEHQKTDCTTW